MSLHFFPVHAKNSCHQVIHGGQVACTTTKVDIQHYLVIREHLKALTFFFFNIPNEPMHSSLSIAMITGVVLGLSMIQGRGKEIVMMPPGKNGADDFSFAKKKGKKGKTHLQKGKK